LRFRLASTSCCPLSISPIAQLRFYVIDAEKIAADAGLRGRVNNVMQTVFFQLSNVLPIDQAIALLKQAIKHTYQKKGDDVVRKNFDCVDAACAALHPVEVPASWADASLEMLTFTEGATPYFKEIASPCLRLVGNSLPTSIFVPYAGGSFPTATAKFEKRGVAAQVPRWNPSLCINCNFCAMACPHASVCAPPLIEEA